MTLDWRQKRIARNETTFRDINERLEAGLRQVPHTPELLPFICECGDRDCEQSVLATFDEYRAVRTDSRRFMIVPGHGFPEAERVVATNQRYEVVEKVGEAVELTDAADRRALGTRGQRSDTPTP